MCPSLRRITENRSHDVLEAALHPFFPLHWPATHLALSWIRLHNHTPVVCQSRLANKGLLQFLFDQALLQKAFKPNSSWHFLSAFENVVIERAYVCSTIYLQNRVDFSSYSPLLGPASELTGRNSHTKEDWEENTAMPMCLPKKMPWYDLPTNWAWLSKHWPGSSVLFSQPPRATCITFLGILSTVPWLSSGEFGPACAFVFVPSDLQGLHWGEIC